MILPAAARDPLDMCRSGTGSRAPSPTPVPDGRIVFCHLPFRLRSVHLGQRSRREASEALGEAVTNILLRDWQEGDLGARDALIARLYPELAQIAAARLRREDNSSLSTGDLINDTILRLIQMQEIALADRTHFIALASRMMRQILIDYARSKISSKRKHAKVELVTDLHGGQRLDLISLDSALIRLKALDAELVELVEMRYFGGMTTADIAEVTGMSEPTVKRRWQVARAWLTDALANPIEND